jgi:pyruvate formate-lyase/glycerol dehydratase family glycyl radical enzyme
MIFGNSSERIEKMRARLIDTPSTICTERAKIITDVYRRNEDKPVIIKRAMAIREILRNMSISIEDGELIVGNQASKLRAAPIFPEYAVDWIIKELDDFEKRPGDRFYVDQDQKDELRQIALYWQGKTLKDKGLAIMPEDSRILYDIGVIRAEGNITSGDGHIAVNYEKLLKFGINGILEQTKDHLASIDYTNTIEFKKTFFLRAVLIVLEAVKEFANRFAVLALEMSEAETDSRYKAEMAEIARICNTVPQNPASSFREAIQSIWFVHLVLQIESNGHSVSFGRLDQYLYPYFQKNMALGLISEEEACELLENLWLKTYSINKIRSWSHTKFSAGSPLYQNVTIGGQTPDGKDAVNELSCLVLKSVGRVKLTQPNLTVRYHRNMSGDFLKSCMELVKMGFGMPAFNNDEVIIPSFINLGIKEHDAFNYSAIGCVEVAVPGKWGYRCTGMSFLNFAKTLMIALNDGVDMVSGKKASDGYKHFLDMKDFGDVTKAWSMTVKEYARQTVIIDMCADMVLEQETPDILCSSLTDDCIERGLHLKEGGAVYDFISGPQVGIANLGNSLAAIKKTIFDDGMITREQLWQAIVNNYEGAEGERIRQLLLNCAPKFGNDDDYVDKLLVEAFTEFIDEIEKHRNTRYGRGPIGGGYFAGTSSISANVPSGAVVGATPDGRKAFTPLAEGCSPSHGTDVSGPTAVFNSVAKLPASRITGGVLLNQKIAPSLLNIDNNTEKFMQMIRVFFDELKGFHVQYNVVSRETLMDAKVHPEKHKNLIVRVAGYSAFFNVLAPEMQDDIINRTEQTF